MSLLAQGFDGAHDLLIRPDAKVMCPDFNQSARAGHPVLTLPGQSLNLVDFRGMWNEQPPLLHRARLDSARWPAHGRGNRPSSRRCGEELADWLEGAQARLDGFLGDWLHDPRKRVIFTGAGSSGFIAEMVADHINAQWPADVRAVHTTSLLTHPSSYLTRDRPTLLVSFGRSGSSPESVAAVDLVRSAVDTTRFLDITCNADGELARRGKDRADTCTVLMPAASCDRAFARLTSIRAIPE